MSTPTGTTPSRNAASSRSTICFDAQKHDPRTLAHFLNRMIFCMFAEGTGLVPDKLFTRIMKAVKTTRTDASAQLADA